MNKVATVGKRSVAYTLRKSNRARYMRLSVYPGGHLVVTTPAGVSLGAIEQFIAKKAEWIFRTASRLAKYQAPLLPQRSSRAYATYKEAALSLAVERVAYFNAHYQLPVGRVSIRNQKTRWGSCSKKGNLSFNYKIALLPPRLADYLVVHELCHLREFNHGKKFWALVAEMVPDYEARRRQLKIQ